MAPTAEPTSPVSTTNDRTGSSAGRSSRPALRRVVAGDLDAFAGESWGRRAVLSRADDIAKSAPEAPTTDFSDLFSLDAVDELLSRRALRTPFLRIAKQGSVVDSSQFTGGGGVGAEISDQVRDDHVAALFADGHTVVLQGLHRTWAPATDLATGLTTDLGHPSQINAYVTPASSQGFAAHYDVHDVFVLQVAGTKRWHVHAPVHTDPLRDQPWNDHAAAVRARAREEPLVDEVLHPGDSLYLPRGYLHSATAQGEVSAHLTVGVHVVTRHALLEALVATLADDPELRTSLPLGVDVADPAALAPHVEAVATRMVGNLRDVSGRTEQVTRQVRRRVWTGNRPEPVPPLAQAAAVAAVDATTVVRARRGLCHRVVDSEAGCRLELPDRVLDLSTDAEPAVRALVAGPGAVVGDLPGLDPADAAVLVARLLREGVVIPSGGDGAPDGGTTER